MAGTNSFKHQPIAYFWPWILIHELTGYIYFATVIEYLLYAQSVLSTGDTETRQQAAPIPTGKQEEDLGHSSGVFRWETAAS